MTFSFHHRSWSYRVAVSVCTVLKITVIMENDAGQQFTNLLAMTCFFFLGGGGGEGRGVTLTDEGLDSLGGGGGRGKYMVVEANNCADYGQ